MVLFRAVIFTQAGLGITVLEISYFCATLKDTYAVKRAFNPDFKQSEEELEFCSTKVEDILASCKIVWRFFSCLISILLLLCDKYRGRKRLSLKFLKWSKNQANTQRLTTPKESLTAPLYIQKALQMKLQLKHKL